METSTNHINGSAAIAKGTTALNPYATNPEHIPRDDPFLAQSTQYGRYTPHPDDFTPHYKHWYQSDPKANAFWQDVARKYCTPEYSLGISGPREAFAAGSVVIRVDHEITDGAAAERYSCVNANELSAARKVEDTLNEIGVTVPVIYFCGNIEGRNVTVESRIPGVSLDVAWRYLSAEKINVLKNQCRQILQQLEMIDPSPDEPSYVCRGLNSQKPPSSTEQERNILFADKAAEEELTFTHNDMVLANIIVQNDRVVGIGGWRQSGYFGKARAQKIHQSLRNLEPSGKTESGATWIDLYDASFDSSKSAPLVRRLDTSLQPVKSEPMSSTLDKFPPSDDLETKSFGWDGNDQPTSKTLANLKNGPSSRASSTDRSSPANSVKLATNKKASAATKKALTDAPIHHYRALANLLGEKQGSVSVAGSPSPEKKKRRKPSKAAINLGDEDDSFEDENVVFCICRRPDNHTWMIGCDGDCDDWYHGKCVNIDPRDADLIDRYICPSCNKRGKGVTTWKPMCRLVECRKPARVNRQNPSKYCCDDHGREYMRQHTRHLKLGSTRNGLEDLGSMGGILTAGDLKAAIMSATSVQEFRRLGDKIISPPPESNKEESPNVDVKCETPQVGDKLGDTEASDIDYSPDETARLEKLRKLSEKTLHRKEMLAARSTFVGLLRQRAKGVVEKLKAHDPKGGWKDICGFDSRLAWSDEEFDDWRLSEAGKTALVEGTVEALAASYPTNTDGDGDTAMDNEEDEMAFWTRGICTKKRCERHKQWIKVQQQDITFEENTADQDLRRYESEVRSVAEKAVLRKWAEKENMPFEAQ
ncbi:uncharacterized protein N7477_000491 [Penicillium maclennaniae]|uniref:uncharacterized protein n=1 Tax=Penicillium maclennaniae TaxID=1343394 RepID=UPI00254120DC|nr:uncharacterized protein N7477_000491 [Penicillium maclennaniae]KAJ5684146.1 hypothetical protein N7477_000491 [Penicillium maclennaniae]